MASTLGTSGSPVTSVSSRMRSMPYPSGTRGGLGRDGDPEPARRRLVGRPLDPARAPERYVAGLAAGEHPAGRVTGQPADGGVVRSETGHDPVDARVAGHHV